MTPPIVCVFVDGVGVGSADSTVNPLVEARPQVLEHLAGGLLALEPDDGPLHMGGPIRPGPRGGLAGLDALLGVDGLPASGTGHAALLTGANAPALHGEHFGPWVPVGLRPLLAHRSLFHRGKALGIPVRFANAYPEPLARRAPPRLQPGFNLAAREAGLLTRHGPSLARGEAVASSLDNAAWLRHAPEGPTAARRIPEIELEEAGRTLASIAAPGGLTLFAHYDTDRVGHRGEMKEAVGAIRALDRFLAGLLEALPEDALLCVVSDHGNLEDVRWGHTRNPALALLHGPGADRLLQDLVRITDVADQLLAVARPSAEAVSDPGPAAGPGPPPPGSSGPRGSPGSATNDGRTPG